MNANELNGIEVCNDKQIAEMDVNHLVEYLNGWYSTAAPRKAAAMLRQQQAEIEALKEVLIKVKELLEQSTEIDFDDMAHIAITSEDECDMRELIEKILSGEDDDEDR